MVESGTELMLLDVPAHMFFPPNKSLAHPMKSHWLMSKSPHGVILQDGPTGDSLEGSNNVFDLLARSWPGAMCDIDSAAEVNHARSIDKEEQVDSLR